MNGAIAEEFGINLNEKIFTDQINNPMGNSQLPIKNNNLSNKNEPEILDWTISKE